MERNDWKYAGGSPAFLLDWCLAGTPEEFRNTHNKETVVGDTWRRTIKNNYEKKNYRRNCALLEVLYDNKQ